ncbi:YqgE/AlgH family protein [Chlorobium phaeovibrioides]|uniref:UPF0301 protein EKD02_07005 n=1 Tax=Chlorobium phaeovibrioides TaxID=1094 RepID=A0A3S0MQ63_CHLPH|nr:YqgE/AlgH family protein [Chlorobium phaeovibrioides]KAA6232810.1 YqgE/AlgH family protein [Chlorobium phaeovibrioides]RTY37575.1 YqgE/AlgH family protein [Chlorobium phaeovibrioides]
MVNEFERLAAGKLLIASANLMEGTFKRTVLLMCEHSSEGSVAFILNRPMEFKVSEAIAGFGDVEEPLLMGGPVQADRVYFMHTRGDLVEASEEILPGLFWGGEQEELSYLLNTGVLPPSEVRFFLGYSGWNAGQLEEEFEVGSWYTTDATRELVFSDAYEWMWSRTVRSKGGEYQLIANSPELPGLN